MSVHLLFGLILAILIFDFLLEKIVDFINFKHLKTNLPDEVKDIYDNDKYQKQQEYERVNYKFKLVSGIFSFILIISMLIFGGFAILDSYVGAITSNIILKALLFFGVLFFASDILNIPFEIYDTFVIEQKFGFNTMTIKTYLFDKIKGWLLGAILGGGILALIVWLISTFPTTFWIYAWLVVAFISIFMAMFYSSLIVPLFNKQTPLEDGELKQSITEFSGKAGFKLQNIYVIDGSKRSTKANAYFSGLGSKKRIVLFDTLIQEMSVNEIVAVLAHEIGHYKKKHVKAMIAFSILQTGMMFFILGFFVNNAILSQALGATNQSIHMSLIAFAILYSPLSFVFGIFMNIFSRKNEYEADSFAAEKFESKELQNALKKLSVKNLSNLTPHPLYVFFNYSHPPLIDRLQNLKKYEK